MRFVTAYLIRYRRVIIIPLNYISAFYLCKKFRTYHFRCEEGIFRIFSYKSSQYVICYTCHRGKRNFTLYKGIYSILHNLSVLPLWFLRTACIHHQGLLNLRMPCSNCMLLYIFPAYRSLQQAYNLL